MKKGDKEYFLVRSVLLAGSIIVSCGGETFRAEDTMCRILFAGGATDPEITVFSTSVSLSFIDEKGELQNITKRIKERGINLGKIARVNELSRRFCSGSLTIDELYQELLSIEKTNEYPRWLIFVCMLLTPAAFTVLLGGNALDCIVAGINGAVIALITSLQRKLLLHPAVFNVLIGISIAFISYSVQLFPDCVINLEILIPGSIMSLLPGVTLTNGVHDLLNADFMSGSARLMEAVVAATTLAVGVGFGLALAANVLGGVL